MNILTGLRRAPRTPADTPKPKHTDAPPMRFLTLGGAAVVAPIRVSDYKHPWECLGCGCGGYSMDLSGARDAANKHAGQCRSMPKPGGA